MWMRTTMNYQYRHGTSTREALRTLYSQGGIFRFYRGVGPALFQGPLSRFGDTAANEGIMSLFESTADLRATPTFMKTAVAGLGAASWRIFLMPIDTLKTTMQVEGKDGLRLLAHKLSTRGPSVLYHGALAASTASFVGFYPWFLTFNTLQEMIPKPDGLPAQLGRNAMIGFISSSISDTCSNSIRVVKTFRQTSSEVISYPDAVRHIVDKDGLIGLFGRGLQTRIMANGVQGAMFAVAWKYVQKLWVENVEGGHVDKHGVVIEKGSAKAGYGSGSAAPAPSVSSPGSAEAGAVPSDSQPGSDGDSGDGSRQ